MMEIKLMVIPLIVLILFTFSCQKGKKVAEESVATRLDIDSEVNELLAVDREWAETAQGGDIDRICDFWTEDAVLYNLFGSGRRVAGKDIIREFVIKSRSQPGRSLKWTPIEAFVTMFGDVGCTKGTYEVVLPGEDGRPVTRNGEYFNVWKKSGSGQWKCAIETHY